MRRKWANQVRRTRDKWEPAERSVICSKHFEEWCFEPSRNLSVAMGMKKMKASLKPGAIPMRSMPL